MADIDQAAELNALEKAVNDAAGRTGALWLGFITLATYLAIAAGSVTHRNLLLETPLKLPLLNVDLPLYGFFVVAPAFFLVFHFFLLLQLHGLARKVSEYDRLLRSQDISEAAQRLMRLHLDNFIFVQVLAGPRYRSDKIVSSLLRHVAWITAIGMPLMILLMMQFTFLPYHSQSATWLHRFIIGIDVVLVLFFWPVVSGRRAAAGAVPKVGVTSALACVALVLALVVAIFPGEEIYNYVRTPLTRVLFEGSIDPVTGRPRSLFANRLTAPDEVLIRAEDLERVDRTISLRGRDLRGAVLSRSDLRKADFTGAVLIGAVLIEANLQSARFGCAEQAHGTGCTDMRSADLSLADLRNARLQDARLQGASLASADLRDASLMGAKLIGVDLRSAKLNGAKLNSAILAGASFDFAYLEGAMVDPDDFSETSTINATGLTLEEPSDDAWVASRVTGPSDHPTREELARRLEKLACESPDAPHVARGILRNWFLTQAGKFLVPVAEKFKSATVRSCRGAVGLLEHDLVVLQDQLEAARKL